MQTPGAKARSRALAVVIAAVLVLPAGVWAAKKGDHSGTKGKSETEAKKSEAGAVEKRRVPNRASGGPKKDTQSAVKDTAGRKDKGRQPPSTPAAPADPNQKPGVGHTEFSLNPIGPARPSEPNQDTVRVRDQGNSRGGLETAMPETATQPATNAAGSPGNANAAFAPAGKAVPSAASQTTLAAATASSAAALYNHNNSTMKFLPEGDTLRVLYDKPRDGLGSLGITPGTPLFEGKKTGPNTYAGEATTFSRTCGAAKFPVAGDVTGGRIVMRGQAPSRGSDCKVTGYRSETLVFEAKVRN